VRRKAAAALILFFLVPLHCRRAEGVQKDPLVAQAEEALVGYLRIDTSRLNETEGAKFLQQLLVREGIEAKLVGANPARQSVYARLVSGSDEKALLLASHIDVVPAIASEWTKPPFSGARDGGYIWGRGAIDAKSLTIAQLMALVDLKRRGVKLKRDVVFLAVADEELGGLEGMKALLDTRPELFARVGFVLNEAGANTTLVDRVLAWGIEVHQKVPLWLRVTSTGIGGHGALPPDGGGSAAKLVRALGAIASLETPYRLSPSVRMQIDLARRARRDPAIRRLDAVREPLDAARLEREVPPGMRSLLRDTITITRMSAGTSVNVVPASASADVDIRLLPDTSPDDMLRRVTGAVGKDGKVEVLLPGQPSPASATDTELYRVLTRVMTRAEPGSVVLPIVSPGTSDSRYLRARGMTAYGIAPFKVNYYDADGIHGVDERIRARFFAEGVRLTGSIVREFCAAR
jgi:acetylornithine deacetylase/succinyl-diaminopimelate desuccinylase-like protein